jgi:hypothetical protein
MHFFFHLDIAPIPIGTPTHIRSHSISHRKGIQFKENSIELEMRLYTIFFELYTFPVRYAMTTYVCRGTYRYRSIATRYNLKCDYIKMKKEMHMLHSAKLILGYIYPGPSSPMDQFGAM